MTYNQVVLDTLKYCSSKCLFTACTTSHNHVLLLVCQKPKHQVYEFLIKPLPEPLPEAETKTDGETPPVPAPATATADKNAPRNTPMDFVRHHVQQALDACGDNTENNYKGTL